MGEILSGDGTLSPVTRRCLPPRRSCVLSTTAGLLQASAGVSLNQGQARSTNSSVQATRRPSIPKLRVYLKFKVLKANFVGGFVWFIILRMSERGSEEGQE